MNTVAELIEVLSSYGITQCDDCNAWGEGMDIDETRGLLICLECSGVRI
jgi:hypothetical protein